MRDCKWIKSNGPRKYKCELCGFGVDDPLIRKNCPKLRPKSDIDTKQLQPPQLAKRLFNFGKAAIKHWVQGSPTCSDEEIQARLKICRKCELFKKFDEETGVCTHENCGCNITSIQKYLNKLAWADQSCPIGKWGPIDKNGV